MKYCAIYQAPLGPLYLTSDGERLTGLWMREIPDGVFDKSPAVFSECFRWLDAYFGGNRPPVDSLPLSPAGTEFQQRVWKLLLSIPYGTTRTYGDLASEIAAQTGKSRMSPQAIGGAVGRNPISIIIPCHRVIGADGGLTGYASGIERKEWLLRHEEVIK